MINRQRENKNKKQLVVSKTIQTVRSSTKNPRMDDVQFNILDLAKALKSRSRKAVTNITLQPIDTVPDVSGDDRSMWRSTWAECVNLYILAIRNGTLKKDDKDLYLPAKLFGYHFMFGAKNDTNIFYEFFINRMIAATFHCISRRQELSDTAIDRLMMAVVDVDKLVQYMMPNSWRVMKLYKSSAKIIKAYYHVLIESFCQDHECIKGLDGPDVLKKFYDSFREKVLRDETETGWFGRTYTVVVRRKPLNEDDVHGALRKELEKLRMEIGRAHV